MHTAEQAHQTAQARQKNDDEARAIETHLPWVQGIAKSVFHAVGRFTELDDLVADGLHGLLEAWRRFDPARGHAFRPYAYYRVRGAMMDGIRQRTSIPKRLHRRLRAMEAGDNLLESFTETQKTQQRHRQASQPAPTLETSLGNMHQALSQLTTSFALSCAQTTDPENPADPSSHTDEPLIQRQTAQLLTKHLAALNERERIVLEQHYLQGEPFVHIAEKLGVSKSWVSRLHFRAIKRLRTNMARLREDVW